MLSRILAIVWTMALVFGWCGRPTQQSNNAPTTPVVLIVNDQTGASVPAAEVHIQSIGRNLATDGDGKLSLEVPPGGYDLTIKKAGFATLTTHIEVHDGKAQTVTVVLNVQACPPGPCLMVMSVANDIEPSPSPVEAIESTVRCVDVASGSELPPPGPACEKELFSRRGRPYMFSARDGIAYGVSYSPDKHSVLYLWAENQTDEAMTLYLRCAASLFDRIDVFDAQGHRLSSKNEELEQKARSEGRVTVNVCSCCGEVSVPPHTVQLFDTADISQQYVLQPGHYTITERLTPAANDLAPTKSHSAPPGSAISLPYECEIFSRRFTSKF